MVKPVEKVYNKDSLKITTSKKERMKKKMKRRIVTAVLANVFAVSAMATGVFADDTYEVVMQWPAIGDAPAGLEDVEAAANEMLEEIGVTLKLEPVNAFNLATETSLAVSSGEKLDLSLSLFTGIGSLVDNGSLLELDDLLDEYGQDIESILTEEQKTGGLYNGQMYAVPIAYINGNDQAFIARKDILDKYGIEIDAEKIYTFEELEQIFATVKEGEGNGFYMIAGGLTNGFPFGAECAYDVCGQSVASGVVMIDGDEPNTIVNLFATDEYKEYADQMYAWNQAGYFSPDASTNQDSATTLINGGNYFGTFMNYSGSNTLVDYQNDTGYEGVAIRTMEAVARSNDYSTVLWSIPSSCDNPEKTMEFLNFLYKSPELTNLLKYGIEGVSYEVVDSNEDGTLIQFPEGENAMTVPYWQVFGVYGNRLSWYIQEPNAITLNKELKEFSDGITKKSSVLGYIFNIGNVSAKYSAVDAVVQQYVSIISSGSIDPEQELPEFLSALETAGIDDVIAENQKQLDEWRENQ